MTWYFTFGMDSPNANKVVKIEGTFSSAREKMFSVFGAHWAFQYSEEEWTKILERGFYGMPLQKEEIIL